MRIAVLADVHGNIAALTAVLADLARRGTIDLAVNLGDCVSGPLWPAETCSHLMRQAWPTVRGNHDRAVARGDGATLGASDAFAHGKLSADARTWLGHLPELLHVAPDVIACHGRPDTDTGYLLDDIADGRLIAAAPETVARRLGSFAHGPRLILCGHSHQPRLLQLEGGPLVLNPGSVGCPAYDDDGAIPHVSESASPHARCAIVELTDDRAAAVDFLAVPYDHQSAARCATANGRPDWAHALATGFQRQR